MEKIKTDKERLYDDIMQNGVSRGIEFSDLGEDMAVGEQVIRRYWKPRFLIDHRNRTAVEFMNKNEMLLTLDHDEIMWETLAFAGKKVLARAEDLSFHFLRLSTDIKMVLQKWNGSSIPTECTTWTTMTSARLRMWNTTSMGSSTARAVCFPSSDTSVGKDWMRNLTRCGARLKI